MDASIEYSTILQVFMQNFRISVTPICEQRVKALVNI